MSKVDDLERAVSNLSREELDAFRRWFIAFDAEAWDAEIERDAAAGGLDAFAEEALREHSEGRTRPL